MLPLQILSYGALTTTSVLCCVYFVRKDTREDDDKYIKVMRMTIVNNDSKDLCDNSFCILSDETPWRWVLGRG